MNLRTLITLSLTLATCSLQSKPVEFKGHEAQQRYIVVYKHSLAESPLKNNPFELNQVMDTIRSVGGDVVHQLPRINAVAANLSTAAVTQLANRSDVAYIEPDVRRELTHAGIMSWGVEMVQSEWVSDAAASNQKVCIIDTGYDINHEDLPSGANITGETSNSLTENLDLGDWSTDSYGHGTHIAGTLAALNNNIGLRGILPNNQLNLHIVKVIHNPNYWSIWGSDLIAAVGKCQSAGATIINMSLAGQTYSAAEDQAMEAAYDAGALLVAASGNRGNSNYFYPASYDSVISVGALDSQRTAWRYTQVNDQIELAAPGVSIKSTTPGNNYRTWDGTSMAVPHVVGSAALAWSHHPECSNKQIRRVLQRSAKDLGDMGRDTTFGFGIVQAEAAKIMLDEGGCAAGSNDEFFIDEDDFKQQDGVTLVEDFELWPLGIPLSFYQRSGITWSSPVNLYVALSSFATFDVAPSSSVLMSVGVEDITLTFDSPKTKVGFSTYLNSYGGAQITVNFNDGTSQVFTHEHASTVVGFWGISSDTPIKSIRWLTPNGQIVNTAIDNLYTN